MEQGDGHSFGREAEFPVSVPVVWVEEEMAAVCLPSYFCEMYHHPEGYSGYTQVHLPVSIWSPPAWKKLDAIPAIRAARMARSSFPTLSRLR